jgi:hypothetical protein
MSDLAESHVKSTLHAMARALRGWRGAVRVTEDGFGPRVQVHDDDLGLLLAILVRVPDDLGTEGLFWTGADLAVEASVTHERQPYGVLIGCLLMSTDTCGDGSRTFANAVAAFRKHTGRVTPADGAERLESIYVSLFDDQVHGRARFFDVTGPPPRSGPPREADTVSLPELIRALRALVDERNGWAIEWGESEAAST